MLGVQYRAEDHLIRVLLFSNLTFPIQEVKTWRGFAVGLLGPSSQRRHLQFREVRLLAQNHTASGVGALRHTLLTQKTFFTQGLPTLRQALGGSWGPPPRRPGLLAL